MDVICVKGGGAVEDHVCFSHMMSAQEGKPCPGCALQADSCTPAIYHLPPGTVLKERYLIGRALGEGGFGITYIGCDLRLKMRVAIKEYFPKDKANRISRDCLELSCYAGSAAGRFAAGKEQFLHEALTLAKMDKQSVIVGVRDFFEENNTAYIVMEYVDGATFKNLVESEGGRIPPEKLLKLMEPLFSALSDMHAQGLIHRDISPDNLMLENGEIRLLDFGCAREANDGDTTLTATMKQGYAPVEQYQNRGQGPWSDVYALSATLYYCLTGIKPPQAVDRLVEDTLLPPRKLDVALTERQEQAILRGMDVRPRRRFQSVQELHDALYETADAEAFRPTPPEQEQPSPERKKTKKHVRIAAFIAAALMLAIALAVWIFSIPKEEKPAGLAQNAPFDRAERLDTGAEDPEEALRAALADEKLPAVVIPAGSCPEVLSGPLEITKPLLIEAGAELHTFQSISISGEGLLRVEGKLENYAPVCTAREGRLEIGPAGSLNGRSLIWLENSDSMTVAEGGSVRLQGENWYDAADCFAVMDEETLFQNAVHVTTLEEYDRCRLGTVPIVIDADISLTDYNRCHTVPVLISQGVCVSVPVSEEIYCSWDVNGTLLVNRGTIRGQVAGGDWTEDGIDSAWQIINYGTIDGSFVSATDSGMLINLGTLRGDGSSTGGFYNFGTLIPADFWICGGPACSTGGIRVGQSGYGRLVLSGLPDGFGNSGVLEIGAQGELYNHSVINNYGRIATTDAAAKLWNGGLVRSTASSSIVDMAPDSTLGDNGVIQYGGDTVLRLSNNRLNSSSTVAFRAGADVPRTVRTEAELRMALLDNACELVAIHDSSIAVTGGLTVTKGLVIDAPGSLTVSGGDLTVCGEGAFLLGDVDLDGNVLRLLDGANVLGTPVRCGGLAIQGIRSKLAATGDFSLIPGAEAELRDSGALITLGTLELKDSRLVIGENWSTLRACGGLRLEGCDVEIAREGQLLLASSGYWLDLRTTVVNHGYLEEVKIRQDQSRELACSLTNDGWLELLGGARIGGNLKNNHTVQISGDVTLSGALDNQGSVLLLHGGIQKEDGAVFTGAPPQPQDAWTVPEI